MFEQTLCANWKMRICGEETWYDAKVPGTALADLMNAGRMDDPYYRDNEFDARTLADNDFEYVLDFEADTKLLKCPRVELVAYGLDTLAALELNGRPLGETNNMHRTWVFDLAGRLNSGCNRLRIVFSAATKYLAQAHERDPIFSDDNTTPGASHLRKAHCMGGWDWSPKLLDAGIFRPLVLRGWANDRIEDVLILQHHAVGGVELEIQVQTSSAGATVGGEIETVVTAPGGQTFACSSILKETAIIHIDIANPELWWPHGFGAQPLYAVETRILQNGTVQDVCSCKIGLRILTMDTSVDEIGSRFNICANGLGIFAMGADYVLEDSMIARRSPQKTRKLLEDGIAANMNCLRVWGGASYPDDWFYELCDELGLIVWQDFMFACCIYRMGDEFAANIKQEAIDVLRRIRHHACLGLMCGNNEMEWAFETWDFDKTPVMRVDYIKQYEILLRDVCRTVAPQVFYWPASPSSGGAFDDPNSPDRGDVHYWEIWQNLQPFTQYRSTLFRFCSEFGFEAFPDMKTVESFTLQEDRNAFSRVMEHHQKKPGGNGVILHYLSETFKYPKDFKGLVMTSQILQAEAVRCGVEHWRRNRGRCMGAIYWQLNDCWPVASWSSVDYFGRWKALHYFARRFFAPVLCSACDEGPNVSLHVCNETMESVSGLLQWFLRDGDGAAVLSGRKQAAIPALSSRCMEELDFSSELVTTEKACSYYLDYRFTQGGTASGGTVLFCPPKHYDFKTAVISLDVKETWDDFEIAVVSNHFAKFVMLNLTGLDGVFSDNFFDLNPQEKKRILLPKASLRAGATLEDINAQIVACSIRDTDNF